MEFSPSIYEHAARVIGKSPWEVSRNGELLFQGQAEAFRLYRHAPVVIGIDIYNLEAEAYGASVARPVNQGIPAISRHVCATVQEITKLKPFNPKLDGRIPMVLEVGKRISHQFPQADVRIPLSGPFSLAGNLVGLETLLSEILTNPAVVVEALHYLVDGQIKFCKEIVMQGLDVSFFESAAAPPLLSPSSFRSVELPPLKAVIEKAAAIVDHPVACIMGGDTAGILEAILATGTGYVCCPAETDQQLFMDKMKAHPEVMVRVNTDPRIWASNNWQAVCQELDRVLALAQSRDKSCIGTGALPYETNPENVQKARKYILSEQVCCK